MTLMYITIIISQTSRNNSLDFATHNPQSFIKFCKRIMTCRNEHFTRENHASVLQNQLRIRDICRLWQQRVEEWRLHLQRKRRQKFVKRWNTWLALVHAIKAEAEALCSLQVANLSADLTANWDLLFSGSVYKLAFIYKIPRKYLPGGSTPIDGQDLGRIMVRRSIREAWNHATRTYKKEIDTFCTLIDRAQEGQDSVSYAEWMEALRPYMACKLPPPYYQFHVCLETQTMINYARERDLNQRKIDQTKARLKTLGYAHEAPEGDESAGEEAKEDGAECSQDSEDNYELL